MFELLVTSQIQIKRTIGNKGNPDTGSKRARTNTPQDEGTKPKRKALQPRNEDTGTTNSFMGNNKATKINQIGTRFDIEIENLFIIAAINLSEITL
jgi:hypothetical protein